MLLIMGEMPPLCLAILLFHRAATPSFTMHCQWQPGMRCCVTDGFPGKCTCLRQAGKFSSSGGGGSSSRQPVAWSSKGMLVAMSVARSAALSANPRTRGPPQPTKSRNA